MCVLFFIKKTKTNMANNKLYAEFLIQGTSIGMSVYIMVPLGHFPKDPLPINEVRLINECENYILDHKVNITSRVDLLIDLNEDLIKRFILHYGFVPGNSGYQIRTDLCLRSGLPYYKFTLLGQKVNVTITSFKIRKDISLKYYSVDTDLQK